MTTQHCPDDERLALDALEALRNFDWNSTKPSRGKVDVIWRAIATGLLSDEDTARWAQKIAKNVVKHVIEDTSTDRPERALKALKLTGKAEAGYSEQVALSGTLASKRLVSALTGKAFVPPTPVEAADILRAQGSYQGIKRKAGNDRAGRALKNLLANWVGPARKR
jgi:hypothetical protein